MTREPYFRNVRITSFMETGELYTRLEMPPLTPATDRAMICGSTQMIADTAALLEQAGLKEGSNAAPADYVIEKAFVG